MAPFRPLVGQLPHVVVQRVEHLGGHAVPVVGRPAPDDRVQPDEDHLRVVPAQGLHLGGQPRLDPFHGRLARFDQQLAAVAADVKSQEVHPVIEVDDGRFVLIEGKAPGRQPRGEPRLDLLGLLTGVT